MANRRRAHSISSSSSDAEEQEKVIKREKKSQESHKSDSESLSSDNEKSERARHGLQHESSSEESCAGSSKTKTPSKSVAAIKKEIVSNSESESEIEESLKNVSTQNSKSLQSFEGDKHHSIKQNLDHIKRDADTSEDEASEEEILKPSKHPHQCVDDSIYRENTKKPILAVENISNDDCEFWIVQCPQNLDPQTLLEKKLTFGGDSKLKVKLQNGASQKLDVTSKSTPQKSMTFIVKGRKKLQAVQVPMQGRLTITEHIEENEELKDYSHLSDKKSKVPFPEGLKLRHPLLGAEYGNRLESLRRLTKQERKRKRVSTASEKLQEVLQHKKRKEDVSPEPKKQKAEEELQSPPRHKKVKRDVLLVKREVEIDVEVEHPVKHKKKKSKKSNYENDD